MPTEPVAPTTARDAPWLLVVAAPAEATSVLGGLGADAEAPDEWVPREIDPGLDLVRTGVGKANAAAAVGIALRSRTYSAVVNLGIAGALPCASPLKIGDVVAATRSVYADEGLEMPDGSFVGCSAMGFPLGPFDDSGIPGDSELLDRVEGLVSASAPVATVSTCSGTDSLARRVAGRTGAIAEAMEGAAVGHVAMKLGVPFLELRVISNTTGDRDNQVWAIGEALARLGTLASRISDRTRTR